LRRDDKAARCVVRRALVQPLCAILGAFASARSLGEGTAAGTAAAARLVTPTRTAECILACLHAIFGRHKLSDPSQARLRSTLLVRAAPPAELVSAAQPAQVVGVSQSLVLVLGLPHDVRFAKRFLQLGIAC
jgi:hypothetical protein